MVNGRFELIRRIGAGQHGEVYSASRLNDGRMVALKFQDGLTFESTEDFEYFGVPIIEEAEKLKDLRHVPGVPYFFERDDFAGRQFFAMEFVPGNTLATFAADKRPLLSPFAASIAGQLCEILGGIHSAGLVHCDVKPANIVIQPNGRLRLIDVGIAAELGSTAARRGSHGWAAPEQYEEGRLTAATDLYALGCLLFHLGALQRPFAHWAGRPAGEPFPDGLSAAMPEQLQKAAFAMIQLHPADRPSTAGDAFDLLWPLIPKPGAPPHPKAPDPDPSTYFRLRTSAA